MHGINKNKDKFTKRLNKIAGQVRGVQKMVEEDKYCIDIITQTSAIKSAMSALEDEMLGAHLLHCLDNQTKQKGSEKVKDEILKVYKLKRK